MKKLRHWLTVYWKQLFFLSLLVCIVYANALNNGFVSDDVYVIVNNPAIAKISYVFSQPTNILRNFLYFAIINTAGLSPIFFRLINVFFHIGSVWTLFALCTVLFPETSIAIFVASIFAVHPILVESVTWISGGFYSQYGFFLLLSLLLYVVARKRHKWYYLSLLAFFMSLITSEKAIVFPLILAAWEVSREMVRENWKKLAPFFAISGVWGILLISKLGSQTKALETQYYVEAGGFHNPLVQLPVAISSYLQLIFWPGSLSLYHSELAMSGFLYVIHLIILICFLGLVVYFYKKNKMVFFWLLFFVLSLGVTLLPLKISWIVAERYVYLGTASIAVLFSMLLHQVFKKYKSRQGFYIIGAIIILFLGARTIVRNNDWKDQDTLFLSLEKTAPSDPKTHNNLGDVYARRGDLRKAIYEFKQATILNPGYADAYHNLANTYHQDGKINDALANYQKAVEINPRLWQSYQNMAAIYFAKKKYDKALENMKKASSINPGNTGIKTNIGIIYLIMGQKALAKEAFLDVLQVDPQNGKARAGLMEAGKL